MSDRPPPLDLALVQEFVVACHGADVDAVRALLDREPALVNAAWDWGGGDWETGLGGAAHMDRRDVALLLLEQGARLDLFAAAMLGELEVVRPVLAAFPSLRDASRPHGIPLVEHARAGGAHAREVLELLETSEVPS
jgi:hypothetical protein